MAAAGERYACPYSLGAMVAQLSAKRWRWSRDRTAHGWTSSLEVDECTSHFTAAETKDDIWASLDLYSQAHKYGVGMSAEHPREGDTPNGQGPESPFAFSWPSGAEVLPDRAEVVQKVRKEVEQVREEVDEVRREVDADAQVPESPFAFSWPSGHEAAGETHPRESTERERSEHERAERASLDARQAVARETAERERA